MDYEYGESLTRWTVRIAVACYLGRVWIDLGAWPNARNRCFAKMVWTAGCLFYLLHVAAAFHVYHHWSHAAAYAHTARQTAELTGIAWGGGLYFNYAFTLLWIADVLTWWAVPGQYGKSPPGVSWARHTIFAFMIFNATVVFGPPFWKPVAAVVAAMLLLRAIKHRRRG